MNIDITFLGTGQAVPTVQRNHTAVLLRYKDEMILFDCGEGTQRQLRKAKINPCRLTRIFISHWHGDHILGLPGLLQTLALNNYSKTLYVYGPVGTKKYFYEIMRMFIFVGKIKYVVKEIKEGNLEDFKDKDFEIKAYKLEHGCPTLGYVFIEKNKTRINMDKIKKFGIEQGPIIGKLQKDKVIKYKNKTIKLGDVSYVQTGKKIAFIFDTGICGNCYKLAENSDLLISESTYLHELADKAKEYKHLTSVQAAEIAKKSKAKKLALMHISQRHEYEAKKMLGEAKKIFKNTVLAEDFMRISV